jgi:hypothetical protein
MSVKLLAKLLANCWRTVGAGGDGYQPPIGWERNAQEFLEPRRHALVNGQNAIEVFGNNVSRNGTWVRDNLPYSASSDIVVNNGVSLTLEPGLTVQFTNGNVGAYVDGTLIARGTAGSPILFTSDKAVKQPGQWKGIDFRQTGGTNSLLENCIVECAAAAVGGFTENIRVENESTSAAVITNCTIRSSGGNGITCFFADPQIQNCGLSNNAGFALSMRADCLPVVRNNSAQGNGQNAIEVFGNYVSRNGTWVRENSRKKWSTPTNSPLRCLQPMLLRSKKSSA